MTSLLSFPVFMALSFIAIQYTKGWNQLGPYDTLTSTLLESYNNHNPPSYSQPTKVEIAIILQSITKLDEFEGTFSAVAWQKLLWKDNRLSWNKSEYDGIKVIRVPAWQIWKPDIILYNSVEERKTLSEVHAVVYSDGTLYHIVPISIKSSCKMDLSRYPYDVQNCTLIWGAWMQDNSRISLSTSATNLDLEDFTPNPIWEIVDTTLTKNIKKYDCCPETYEDIAVSIILRRKQPDSLIASAVIATWMIVIVFIISPPSSSERIIFAGFIFVSLKSHLQIIYLHKSNDILNERRRRYFRLFDVGAMIFIVVLLSVMTGALFAS
nr:acetylcholine receptor subunit alpha-type acr-16-like [Lytechinus pictus]